MMVKPSVSELLTKSKNRYELVIATSKRARQIIAGEEPLVNGCGKKPLSIAVEELYKSKIRITGDDEEEI